MTMRVYYIKTFATEDRPQMTCSYPYRQWVELQEHFREQGIEFEAWKESIEV